MENVLVEERIVPNITVYKILGSPWSVSRISEVLTEARDTATSPDTSPDTSPETLRDHSHHPDWQALYLQFRAEHVLGTLPYRWEPKHYTWERVPTVAYTEAVLIKVCFTEFLKVVVMRGSLLSDGALTGTEKANVIKGVLGLEPSSPLMESLGRIGKCAAVEESPGEWELIIPHSLLCDLPVQEERMIQFSKHPKFPVTQLWQDLRGGMWSRFEEGQQFDCVQDFKPSFL